MEEPGPSRHREIARRGGSTPTMSIATAAEPTAPALELLRFRAVPAGTEVAVLELEGRFASPSPRRLGRPRLLVHADERQVEAAAVSRQEAFAGPDAAVWRALYALPLAAVDGPFTLAVGRKLLLDLPEPHVETAEGAPATHHVRLAREANAQRRRADEAEDQLAATTAEARRLGAELAAAREEIGRLGGELASAQEAAQASDQRAQAERERAAAAAAAARSELETEQARTREAAEQGRRDLEALGRESQEALGAAREESLHRLEEAVSAQRAKTLAARHDLRAARAELEAIRREHPELRVRRGQPHEPGREEAQEDGSSASRDAATTTAEHALVGPTQASTTASAAPDGGGDAPTRPATLERPADDPTEATATVRVLTPRARRPRRDLAAEARDANERLPLPGAAEIGARHIARATGRRDLAARIAQDPTRALAIAALALFALALLVIVLGVGPL